MIENVTVSNVMQQPVKVKLSRLFSVVTFTLTWKYNLPTMKCSLKIYSLNIRIHSYLVLIGLWNVII